MKKTILMITIFTTLALSSVYALHEESALINKQFNLINLAEISNYSETLSNLNVETLARDISTGSFTLNPANLLQNGINLLLREIRTNLTLMLQILMLAIITAILTNLQNSFGKKGVTEIAFYGCYIVIASLAVRAFILASNAAHTFIDSASTFINMIIPPLIILLASSGRLATSTILQPSIMLATQAITYLIRHFFLPLTYISVTLSIAGNLSNTFKLTELTKLMHNVVKWGLGILLTLFVGVISIQTIFAPSIDTRSIMVAEYAVKTFVPVVGSILSDTVRLVTGYASIVKTAVGTAGLIAFAAICITPLLQILAKIGIMQLTAAVIQPISDTRIVKCLSDLTSGLTLIFVMMLTLSIMFFINIAMIIRAGGGIIGFH